MSIMFEKYPDILNVEQVQEALCIGRSLAYRLLQNNELKHFKIGCSYKIPKAYLIEYVMNAGK